MQEKTKEGKKDKRKVKLQLGKDDNKQIIMYAVEVSLDRYFAFNHQSVQLESRGGISRTRRAKGNGGKIILSPLINRDSSTNEISMSVQYPGSLVRREKPYA